MSSPDLQPLPSKRLEQVEFDSLDRKNQEDYLNLLQAEIVYRKSKKILYYEPHPKQLLFHTSASNTRAIFGGNRSGKTTSGGMEFLFHMTGLYPKWYPEAQKLKGPVIGRIVAKDFQKQVGEVIIPFLEEWLDMTLIAKKQRNPIGVPVKWIFKNGSKFDILTHEQNTEQFEGWRGHVAWFDEPPPRDKYIATLRGLVDYRGRNWLTLTPLTQPWLYDEIYTKVSNSIFVVTMDIRDNPYLSEEAIRELKGMNCNKEMHGKVAQCRSCNETDRLMGKELVE